MTDQSDYWDYINEIDAAKTNADLDSIKAALQHFKARATTLTADQWQFLIEHGRRKRAEINSQEQRELFDI